MGSTENSFGETNMNLQNFFVLAVQAFCFSLLVAPAHADITVRDDAGQVLHLTQAPKRIVSLADSRSKSGDGLLFPKATRARHASNSVGQQNRSRHRQIYPIRQSLRTQASSQFLRCGHPSSTKCGDSRQRASCLGATVLGAVVKSIGHPLCM